jgi:hypothetical protein
VKLRQCELGLFGRDLGVEHIPEIVGDRSKFLWRLGHNTVLMGAWPLTISEFFWTLVVVQRWRAIRLSLKRFPDS